MKAMIDYSMIIETATEAFVLAISQDVESGLVPHCRFSNQCSFNQFDG